MTVHRARIVKNGAFEAQRLRESTDAAPTRRVSRFELDARANAERIVAEAQAERERILAEAQREAAGAREQALREALAEGEAKFAAHYAALQLRADTQLAAQTERLMQLAVVMAERLVGEELAVRPERVRTLAESAIGEARGAGALTLEAHPEDAEALRALVQTLRSGATLHVRDSTELERGSLLVHTELGTLDARLRPQLDRLAQHLRAVLRAE